ncbi:ABC-type multidrug transport system ATPase subunit [Clostridium beijerinckii]|nr:ABC-type multidrug transport system ATPase subunit [Clostridium beijerinckii]
MIDIKDANYSYDAEVTALKNVNLHIDEGEAIALIGVNGSGKSTLMKLINGLIIADSGSYLFEGEEINNKKCKMKSSQRLFIKK